MTKTTKSPGSANRTWAIELGRRIREARIALSLKRVRAGGKEVTMLEVARWLDVNAATVGRWESGRKPPSVQRIPLIAKALHCNLGWLMSPAHTGYAGAAGVSPKTRRTPDSRPRSRAKLPPMYYGEDALADVPVFVRRRA